jgi:cell division protein FtsN
MNSHQRGIYQPLVENVPVYDLSDDDAENEERSRLPLMIVIALVVLAAFTGVVWLAYNQGVARGRAGATIVIDAPDGPVRIAPGDAGGRTPFTGLKIYGQPVPPDQEAEASNLAPAAPDLSALAAATAPAASPPQATTEIPPVRLDPGPPTAAPRAAVPPPATAQAPRPAPQTATVQAPPPATAQAPRPAPQTAAVQAPPPAAPPSPPGNGSAVSGAAVLQIGSFESAALADGAWTRFKARYADIAGELSDDVQRADLGARGIWYRLRVGPFKDRPSAISACQKLKTQGATCIVAAP